MPEKFVRSPLRILFKHIQGQRVKPDELISILDNLGRRKLNFRDAREGIVGLIPGDSVGDDSNTNGSESKDDTILLLIWNGSIKPDSLIPWIVGLYRKQITFQEIQDELESKLLGARVVPRWNSNEEKGILTEAKGNGNAEV